MTAQAKAGKAYAGTVNRGSETHVDLVELKEKTTLTREAAAARLHAIADELASNNDVVIERGDLRFVAHVPDQVHLKVEFEIEDDGTELEIELTW
jgi:amphi-Trp domain-containing protein